MKLYLVRHGQTDNNIPGHDHPMYDDVPINTTGMQQAEAAAELLAALDPKVELVLSSPYQRTKQTSQIIAQKLNVDPKIDKNLGEVDWGDWNKLRATEVDPLYVQLGPKIIDFKPPNGESWRDVAERMVRTINAYQAQNHKSLALVSHRDPIRFAIAGLLDGPHADWQNLPADCENGAMFGLEFVAGSWQISFANRTH